MKTKLLVMAICLPLLGSAQKVEPFSVTPLRGNSTGLVELFDGNTQTGWFPGWNSGDYPVSAKVKFNGKVKLNQIKLYDWVGQTNFILLNGQDTVLKVKLNQWNKWQTRSFKTIETDEVTIQLQDIQGDIPITELEFYLTEQVITEPITFSGDALKLGTNGFHWHPTEMIPFPNLRIYQMTQWSWTPKGLTTNPTVQADGMYDEYYQELKDNNITAIPCINKVPNWSHELSTDPEWADLKHNDKGTDPLKPESYKSIAEYGFQLAARYGKVKHPTPLLKVNSDPRWQGDIINIPLSGLNLLSYIELENEPDRPWKDIQHKYTAEEFAAYMSAIYDGHEGRLGQGYGIKQADPDMKVVMAGLSAMNTKYIQQMQDWARLNRTDKKLPCDVINFHHYSNASNQFPNPDINLWQGYGISPIEDNMDYRLKNTVMYIYDNISQTMPVWLSEFGYDTNPCSTPLCQYTSDTLQGKYLIQTMLIALASGVDKMFMYNFGDEPSADKGYVFGSSGLVTNEWKPKPAYNEVKQFIKELNGYTYKKTVQQGEVLVFENKKEYKYFNLQTLKITKSRKKKINLVDIKKNR